MKTETISNMTMEKKGRLFSNIPAPIWAVYLGLVCLGNASYVLSDPIGVPFLKEWGWILAFLSLIPLAFYTLKVVLNFPAFKADVKNPVTTAIHGTMSMGTFLLAAFAARLHVMTGAVIWLTALGFHVLWTTTFLYYSIKGFKFERFFVAYYVSPVGIVCGCMTAAVFYPIFGVWFKDLVHIMFWYGAFWYIALIPCMIARLYQRTIPRPIKPSNIIAAGPPNLLLAAYIVLNATGVLVLDPMFLYFILVCSLIANAYIYWLLLSSYLYRPFHPTIGGYTFPTVIGAVAMFQTAAWFGVGSVGFIIFRILGIAQFIATTAIVLFVAISYLYFLGIKPKIKS